MGIRRHDLKDTVSRKISIDEYAPKTGDVEDIIVGAFYAIDDNAATDVYQFLNNSVEDIRSVEVSPNPNNDGNYLVFYEIIRQPGCLDTIRRIVSDVQNLSGNLKWEASTHLTDDYFPLTSSEIDQYVIEEPKQYMTREEFDKMKSNEMNESISTFLKRTNLVSVTIEEGTITMTDRNFAVDLEIVKFGNGKQVMEDLELHDKALTESSYEMTAFRSMIGRELEVAKIDGHIVITDNENVLVLK